MIQQENKLCQSRWYNVGLGYIQFMGRKLNPISLGSLKSGRGGFTLRAIFLAKNIQNRGTKGGSSGFNIEVGKIGVEQNSFQVKKMLDPTKFGC